MPSATIESRSPQKPSEVVVSAPAADERTVSETVEAARKGAAEWAAASAVQRSAALNAAADAIAGSAGELTDLIVREVGKPVGEAGPEVTRAVNILRYQAQAALDPDGETYPPGLGGPTLLMARRRPRGVAGLITPWNFPIAIPLWKAAPALAFGNAVVLKPASAAIGVALLTAELMNRSLPAGVFQVLTAGGAAAQTMIGQVDVISFTGSSQVGHQVAKAAVAAGIPFQTEMGGQNASIVLADADVDSAAGIVAGAAMGYAGQKCTATSRVIVVGDPGPFTDALVGKVEQLSVGDPADAGVVVGPVIAADARDEVVAAAKGGGRVATGGRPLDRDGWFVAPTIVAGVDPDAPLAQEEVFGPIAAVLGSASDAEAAAISNGVRFGLVTSVFTRDLDRALDLVAKLDTGMIRVNQPTSGVDFHAPFGGEKDSSMGPREQGKHARELYTSVRTITIAPAGP